MQRRTLASRLERMLAVLMMLVIGGTIGYLLIEDWPLFDAFYMTVITISTVGYGETFPLSPEGRWFTSGLIFASLITMTCFSAVVTSSFVEGDLSGRFRERRIQRMIAKMKDHIIVCGSDNMAQAIVERLMNQRQQVVVVDDTPDRLERLRHRYAKLAIVQGRPTDELKMAEANLMDARIVVATCDSEIDNLLIGIACKDVNRQIRVYARANDTTLANSMRRAGIDTVISPSQLCGEHIVGLIKNDPAQTDASVANAGSGMSWA